ncbi:hypothetical protein DFQ30_006071 [Apophysomyces sp. BC1015]|nr:hypothetical protein DFQ30_006071 [Apophysomyces sp. BC1015]
MEISEYDCKYVEADFSEQMYHKLEVAGTNTDDHTWGCLCLVIGKAEANPVVIELAGGIKINSLIKEKNDLEKLTKSAIKSIRAYQNKLQSAKIFGVLFYDLKLKFDILVPLTETEYARKRHLEV